MRGRVIGALLAGACALGVAGCGGGENGAGESPAASAGSSEVSPAGRLPVVPSPSAPTAPRTMAEEGSLRGKSVVIDPGHNGGNAAHPEIINKQVDVITQRKPCDTTGTAGGSLSEASFTWDVSQRLAKILKAEGAKVVMTRKNNSGVGPCITERAAIGNKAKADVAISVHADGAGAGQHGFHVIGPKPVNGPVDKVVKQSQRLAYDIRDAFHEAGYAYSTYIGKKGLIFRDDLGGLNLSTVPKVFLECGNMRNQGDLAKMRTPQGRQRIAEAIADGLRDYLT
ncbi:N-acetylmuramoyl-L-alanine amidase [Bailinhaonella thermotolerans]|uniref:N-acetylmuramoyl-L-alanine amidase n=1 Tax=Bailinhaonella thermotolerans TaxID=1070861 RepID=UPI001F5B98F3|nr:N-acetylmuramoyl-L-alanine amidase [Bailinhaonella thermotolerans]